MNAVCFDIGTFQAFVDGELSPADVVRLTSHVAVCNACATALAIAEDESAIVFPMLEREFDVLVPTQRLWSKINETIAVERQNTPAWRRVWAALTASVTMPTLAATASLLLVVSVVSALLINREYSPSANANIARVDRQVAVVPATTDPINPILQPETDRKPVAISASPRNSDLRPMAVKASYSANEAPKLVEQAPRTADGYLPGEETYVMTISSLAKTVNGQKDSAMKPSERIAYERDMAVVDDAIAKMKSEVKKNPKNESAKQVLYSSYQNKIDLLNSVSQKEELVASLK